MKAMSSPESSELGSPPAELPPRRDRARLHQLDGLRGVAALVVVLSHTAITIPAIAAPYFGLGRGEVGSLEWWVNHTPLKLLTAGTEAVYIFFILSGLVVTLPYFANKNWTWVGYYPRRIIRLYVPTIAAIVIAVGLSFIPRTPENTTSLWLQMQSERASGIEVVRDATLLFGQFRVNNPLWSLKWEIIFSLALPVYVLLVIAVRRRWPAMLAISVFATVALVATQQNDIAYLLMFAIGVIIASQFDRIRGIANQLGDSSRLTWPLLVGMSLIALIAFWLFWPDEHVGTPLHYGMRGLAVVGATVLVIAVCFWKPLDRPLTLGPIQWLGKISFSLYLIHVPVLVTLAFALQDAPRWIFLVMALPAALFSGQIFYWVIERPSHMFANAIGKRASAWGRQRQLSRRVSS